MVGNKFSLRAKYIFLRRKKANKIKNFDFSSVLSLIKRLFTSNQKIYVAGYYPSDYEVNVLNLISKISNLKNFHTLLPKIEKNFEMNFIGWKYNEPLCLNRYGIPEPNKKRKKIIPDVLIVPLVAFDKNLNRIGYGQGYYDRAIKKINAKKNSISIGIAYSFQECQKIPVEKFDQKLNYIFTEKGFV